VTDLTAPHGPLAFFLDLHPKVSDFKTDVVEGLSKPQKSLSPMYLYDARGSQLFEQITGLETYYPTRTEQSIVDQFADEIAEAVGPNVGIFEYGAGSVEKIRRLLAMLNEPCSYVAMDISRDHLLASASALASDIAPLPVGAICADFNDEVSVPPGILPDLDHLLGYFPGSTIGNLTPDGARSFLKHASATLGDDALFLFGIDLKKDAQTLRLAYDDPGGVTAQFNLNLLARMRRELDAEIDIDAFEHNVVVNAGPQRIEMHLRAKKPTTIIIDGKAFEFASGETIHTENSHKYSPERLGELIDGTPWRLVNRWTDDREWFATCLLSNS